MAIEIATVPGTSPGAGEQAPEPGKRERPKFSPAALIVMLAVVLCLVTLLSPGDRRRAYFAAHPVCRPARASSAHPDAAAYPVSPSSSARAGVRAGRLRTCTGRPSLPGTLSQPHRRSLRHRIAGRRRFWRLHRNFFFSQWSVFGFSATALLAFAGSAATMALVYSLARSAGKTNVVTLLLAGFAISTMFTNSSYFFELFDKTGTGNRILALLAARRHRHSRLDRIRGQRRSDGPGHRGCASPDADAEYPGAGG